MSLHKRKRMPVSVDALEAEIDRLRDISRRQRQTLRAAWVAIAKVLGHHGNKGRLQAAPTQERIIRLLRKHGEMETIDLAKEAGIELFHARKVLREMREEKKIVSRENLSYRGPGRKPLLWNLP